MSIEALRDMSFSVQSDVWSYGVTMWEIFSLGQTPFPRYTWSQDFLKLLSEGLRPVAPEYADNSMYVDLYKKCVYVWVSTHLDYDVY